LQETSTGKAAGIVLLPMLIIFCCCGALLFLFAAAIAGLISNMAGSGGGPRSGSQRPLTGAPRAARYPAPPPPALRGGRGACRALRPGGPAADLALCLPRAHRLALPRMRADPRRGRARPPATGLRLRVEPPGGAGGMPPRRGRGAGARPVGLPAVAARAAAL